MKERRTDRHDKKTDKKTETQSLNSNVMANISNISEYVQYTVSLDPNAQLPYK